MIITKLIGGLGNQMFQYAIARALAEKNNDKVLLDVSGFRAYILHQYCLPFFNIQENIASEKEIAKYNLGVTTIWKRICRKIFNNSNLFGFKKYVRENGFEYQPDLLNIQGNAYFDGYWQTEKYFKDINDIIRKEFTLKPEFSIGEKEITKQIKNSNAVSLHIRRGDYVKDATTNKFHGTCSLEYYQNAAKYIVEKVKDATFYIFSDDVAWVRENLKLPYKMVCVSDGVFKNYEELMLMSYCKHNIIANSSFSWWGAWLNNNPDKIVIAPKKWFNDVKINTNDLIPNNWIKI